MFKSYFAFLDVLGFKRIQGVHSPEHIRSVCELLAENADFATTQGRHSGIALKSQVVSDSILIWTDDNSEQSFSHLIASVRSLLAISLLDQLPLRGAISIGTLPAVLDDLPRCEIVQSLSKAEKNQEWSGCEICYPVIQSYVSARGNVPCLITSRDIISYSVPHKTGASQSYAVNWIKHPSCFNVSVKLDDVIQAFAPPFHHDDPKWTDFRQNFWPSVQGKLNNTIKFYNHCSNETSDIYHSIKQG